MSRGPQTGDSYWFNHIFHLPHEDYAHYVAPFRRADKTTSSQSFHRGSNASLHDVKDILLSFRLSHSMNCDAMDERIALGA